MLVARQQRPVHSLFSVLLLLLLLLTTTVHPADAMLLKVRPCLSPLPIDWRIRVAVPTASPVLPPSPPPPSPTLSRFMQAIANRLPDYTYSVPGA